MVAWNDLVDNIGWSYRLLMTVGIFTAVFVLPWLVLIYSKGEKTPALFDAACITTIIHLGYGVFLFSAGWPTSARWWLYSLGTLDPLVWLVFVVPIFSVLWFIGIKAPAEKRNLSWCIFSVLAFFTISALTGRVSA